MIRHIIFSFPERNAIIKNTRTLTAGVHALDHTVIILSGLEKIIGIQPMTIGTT